MEVVVLHGPKALCPSLAAKLHPLVLLLHLSPFPPKLPLLSHDQPAPGDDELRIQPHGFYLTTAGAEILTVKTDDRQK